MVKKTPLYPHVPKSRQSAEKTKSPTVRETLGMKVHLKLRSGEEGYARNMTEIHFGYEGIFSQHIREGGKIAFESNIHGTGFTHNIDEIVEFEATPEIEIAESYWEPIPRR